MMLHKFPPSLLKTRINTSIGIIAHSVRHAHVVGTPPSLFFTRTEQERIRDIAKQANRFKIDYELKYANKIVQKAQRQGVSVQQLKKEVKKNLSSKQPDLTPPPPRSPDTTSKIKTSATTSSIPKLDDIVKLHLLEKESPDQIAHLWHKYHSNKENTINAVIPASIYETIHERGDLYPMFIFPLPRQQGLEFYLLQFHQTQCYFTSLAEYKLRQDQARPFLSLTHYNELQHSKQIVLMHGHIHQPNIVTSQDAQFLAFCVQQFYGGLNSNQKNGDSLFQLVRQFHEQPQDFDHKVLIAAMDELIYP